MHYGIETVKGSHFRRVTLENPARYGLLGKGAIQMLTAYPNRTSPVLRGAWILDRLLGAPPPEPPLNVPTLPENKRGQPAETLRARLEAAPREPDVLRVPRRDGSARACARELQRGRSVPRDDPDTHTPIDATGMLPDGTTINGPERPAPRARQPARSSVRAGFTENLMTYALGRSLDYRDMPTVRRIVRDAAKDNYRFKSIVLGVVSSDAFRKREVEGVTQTSPAQQTQASLQP